MNILGISAGDHDAALSVISPQGDILFAGHSERYSKIKNDPNVHKSLISDAFAYPIDTIAYHERPWLKQLRRVYSGQGLEPNKLFTSQILRQQIPFDLKNFTIKTYGHHLSHAAAGFQTSIFDRATVVVIDAIGEFDTISIWDARYILGKAVYKKLWSKKYPHSVGLFYSAMTDRVGLRPNEEEYILMGMSAYSRQYNYSIIERKYLNDIMEPSFKLNFHLGVPEKDLDFFEKEEIAACTQKVTERILGKIFLRARGLNDSNNLVYSGGVALNCLANRNLGNYFKNIWVMPNPGDAGSSLGAAALAYGSHLNWRDAYLGYNIPGEYPVDSIIEGLLVDRVVGVASGCAEFGPRALGNRSLLADPRGYGIKDKVNEIKRRQKFRPFAPVILEELVDNYFEMPDGWKTSPYMQVVAKCKFPDLFPAIVHVDGTSRVQTVSKEANSGIRNLLEKWYSITGCPMLLNTSLNVRGEPMVNDRADADRFQKIYGIKVFS
jgi:carbamoyltransferase